MCMDYTFYGVCTYVLKQRAPHRNDEGLRKWRLPTLPQRSAVPSAMLSLTTLFGMGRGGTSAL